MSGVAMTTDEHFWTTASGVRMRIVDMSNSHLANTIHYLRREGTVAQVELIGQAYAFEAMLSSDSEASYYMAHDIMLMEQETLCDFLLRTVPQYEHLLTEAEKRGLNVQQMSRV